MRAVFQTYPFKVIRVFAEVKPNCSQVNHSRFHILKWKPLWENILKKNSNLLSGFVKVLDDMNDMKYNVMN